MKKISDYFVDLSRLWNKNNVNFPAIQKITKKNSTFNFQLNPK